MQTWPLANEICVPCVSAFDPPRYVAARLRHEASPSTTTARLGEAQGHCSG